ncbi:hypothetical protein BC332_10662 [Capsicum chinense]|nr:hypothetical protein BC332_10662 [Capsicum chinense]
MEISVNSYHHQGVKKLSQKFVPMAFSPDSLVEDFYDLDTYNPVEVQKPLKLNQEMEKKRKIIVRSFSLARNLYEKGRPIQPSKNLDFDVEAEFLECNRTLSLKQETRLMQMGEIVRNATFYLQKLKINEEKEGLARKVMEKMTMEQLSGLTVLHGFGINTAYTAMPSGIQKMVVEPCNRSQLHQNLPKKSENGHVNLTNSASNDSEISDGEENDDSIVIHMDNCSETGQIIFSCDDGCV